MEEEHRINARGRGIADAAKALEEGKAVIVPTDTVYGLAVAVVYAETPQPIYDIKGRGDDKPIAWLIASPNDLLVYGKDVPDYAKALAKAHWPGPLTLVVPASDRVPSAFRAANGTIGLRVSSDEMVRDLGLLVRSPLATSSANISGQPAPRELKAIDPELFAQAAYVLDDDLMKGGVASTVVDCTGPEPVILREGPLSPADIQAAMAQ